MQNYKKLALLASAFLINLYSIGQSTTASVANEKGDVMSSNGKIYVVMVIVLTILIGLFLFVLRLDRKINRLEKGDFS